MWFIHIVSPRNSTSKIVLNCFLQCFDIKESSSEVVDTKSRKGINLTCLQKVTRWGISTQIIEGKHSQCKLFWVWKNNRNGGVDIFFSKGTDEKKVPDIPWISGFIILIKMASTIMFNINIFLCSSIRIRKHTQKVGFYSQL